MSNIKPYTKLLNRDRHTSDASKHLHEQLELLKSITDYGTFLIAGTFHTSKKQLQDVVVLLVLLKQVVSMVDGIHVLSKNACSQAALLQMRALFEASLYIDWILFSDTEKKAKYYYVSNLRRELLWHKRSQAGSQEHGSFFESLEEFGEALEETRRRLEPDAKHQSEKIEKLLDKQEWVAINSELEKSKGKRKYDPSWYEPLGVKSVRQLSEAMKRLHEYEIFYSQASEKMHGSDYQSHVKFSGGAVTVEPIRSLDGLVTTINYAVSSALHTYKIVLGYYRPGQLSEFSKKYLEYWRPAYLNMPIINYQNNANDPIL